MDERDVELFNDSIERCSASPEFLTRFYTLFIASSGEVAKKFEHTDLRRQARMLKTSLFILMLASEETERIAHLSRLAKLHSHSGLDIRPELYDLWLEKLVQAVSECDRKFDREIEAAWRRVLQPGIDYMKSRY
jgi:hemoglobin-like flavoprotein